MSEDIKNETARKVMNAFFEKYPQMLVATGKEAIAFIETLPEAEAQIYKASLNHIYKCLEKEEKI